MIAIRESDVAAVLDMPTAIAVVERVLAAHALGQAIDMTKTHAAWAGGQLHALGGVLTADNIAGTKTWVHTARGAAPRLLLFDAGNGAALALIDSFALGQLRTGAVSGVATRWLAPPEASELAIIGTGKQARSQVAAVHAVRPLTRVRVHSPTAEHRERLAATLRTEMALDTIAVAAVADAVMDAPIVTLATRATTPFLRADMLARGTHINAIGAITPERAELDTDVVARASVRVVDSLSAAQQLSRELGAWAADGGDWAQVQSIGQRIAARQARPDETDLTLFKAMGMGLCDVALGAEIYRRVVAQG
jgi:ornithine cyclodeaminase